MSLGVKITENFAQRMASTIRRVDAMPLSTGDGKIPVRFEEGPAAGGGGGGSSVSVGTYGTAGSQWEKGATLTVHEYELSATEGGGYTIVPKYIDGSPVTVSVLNLFVTIPPNYDTVRYCAYASVGGVNLLVAAEC